MPVKIRRVDFYPDDWLAATRGMSFAEVGAYWQICSVIYAKGGPVPLEELSRILSGRNFARLFSKLLAMRKVQLEVGMVSVRRALAELDRSHNRTAKALQANAKRWKSHDTSDPTASFAGDPNKQQSTYNNHQKDKTLVPKSAPKRRSYTENAERFWDAYPHRGQGGDPKKPALEVFEAKVRAGADPEEIILGAERYASDIVDKKLEPRFVPQAQKWLRQEYWCDYVSELGPSQHAPQQSRRPNGLPEDYEEVRRRLEGNC